MPPTSQVLQTHLAIIPASFPCPREGGVFHKGPNRGRRKQVHEIAPAFTGVYDLCLLMLEVNGLIFSAAKCAIGRALLMSVIGLLVTAPAALAQESYELDAGEWEKTSVYQPGTPEAELQNARRLLAEDQPEEAIEIIDEWLKQHRLHEMAPDAYLLRGDAKVALGNYYKALFDYEYLLRSYPESPAFEKGLEREFEIARIYAGGVKRKLLGMRIIPAGGEAEELFIRIQERSPGSNLGERASLALADYYFEKGDMNSAAEAYDLFLLNYPNTEYREGAMLRLIQANFATFKGPRFDATGLIDALQRIETFEEEYPVTAERIGTEAMRIRIDESLAAKVLNSAQWYEKRGQRVSASVMYREVIQDHPQTSAAQIAIRRLKELGEPVQVVPVDPTAAPTAESSEE